MIRTLLPVAAVLASATPAVASVALYRPAPWNRGPVVAGERVTWAEQDTARHVRVHAVPVAGGAASDLASLDGGDDLGADWWFAASDRTLAIRTPSRLYVARGAGPFQGSPIGELPDGPIPVAVLGDDLVTVERRAGAGSEDRTADRVFSRPAAVAPFEVALPAGADRDALAVAGELIAVAVDSHAVVLIDRRSGQEVRRVAIPTAPITGAAQEIALAAPAIALSPEGGVVITEPASTESETPFVGFAPPGATSFFAVRLPADVEIDEQPIALAGDRFAYAHDGRVAVVRLPSAPAPAAMAPPTAALLYHGAPSTLVSDLSFDGDDLAWASATCAMLAKVPAPSERRIPPGPCFRAEIAVGEAVGVDPRRPRYGVPMRCVTTVGASCRVTVTLFDRDARRGIARVKASVPIGQARRLELAISRRLARRLRSKRGQIDVYEIHVRLSDGAGRSQLISSFAR
jgi:hypothetical protein